MRGKRSRERLYPLGGSNRHFLRKVHYPRTEIVLNEYIYCFKTLIDSKSHVSSKVFEAQRLQYSKTDTFSPQNAALFKSQQKTFSDSRSPAFGELDAYGVGLKGTNEANIKLWGKPKSLREVTKLFVTYLTAIR